MSEDKADQNPFEAHYQAHNTPWDLSHPQPELIKLAEAEKIVGDVLVVGCGSGENSLYLTERGHMLWGIDIAPSAIETARAKAHEREQEATFVVGSALELGILGEGFHSVIDVGFFHLLSDAEREQYIKGLKHVMFPDARLFLLCFSDKEAPDAAHSARRIKRSEIRSLFCVANGFKVKSIEPAQYELQTHPEGAKAWLAEIKRIDKH